MKKTEKKRLGRPKSSEPRNLYLTGIRVSREELQQIRDDAAKVGQSASAYVRRKLGLPGTGYGEKTG